MSQIETNSAERQGFDSPLRGRLRRSAGLTLYTKRSRPSFRDFSVVIGALLGGVLIVGALTAANARWSALLPGGGSFYSIWVPAREFVVQHRDPYGPAAAAGARALAYGTSAVEASQNPYRLDLPFFLMPVYLPFGLIADPDLARGAWATLGQLAIVASTLFCMRLVEWNPRRPAFWALFMFAIMSYPIVFALIEGSLVVVLLLVYTSVLWAMQSGNDELAGGLAVLALCKWELAIPFLLFVGVRVSVQRRWRILAGLGMASGLLLFLSFLLYPGWPLPFLVSAVAMLRSGHGLNAGGALRVLFPQVGANGGLALTLAIASLLVVEVLGTRGSDDRRFTWATFLALAASPLLGMRSELPNLLMLLPSVVVLAAVGMRRAAAAAWITRGILATLLILPWFISLGGGVTVRHGNGQELIFLLLPVACLIGLYWTRWWFLRPARTWLDEIRDTR